ncbi:MAG: hypothetical protein WCP17_02025 [bacterium]
MNEQELQQNIALYYSKLPPKLQEIFSSMKWLEALQQIATKYGLNEEQIQTLGTETTLVLLGMVHLDEYETTLRKEIVLPLESIDKMLSEINESVINTVRPELLEAFDTNTTPTTEGEIQREEELDERFAKLPEETQDAIRKSNYHATLYKIADEYKLKIPQMVQLETITTNVMLGITKGELFENYIKNALKLSDEQTKELANAITNKILKEIRKEMMGPSYVAPPTDTKEDLKNTQVLSTAGIEVVNKVDLTIPELPAGVSAQAGDKKTGAEVEKIHPLLTQKLSDSVQTAVVKTEHSLENITKASIPIKPTTKVNRPGIDPYRELPE